MKKYKYDSTGKKWLVKPQPVTGWAVLVPGTMEPVSTLSSDCAKGTRQYIVFCDEDAEYHAMKVSLRYPEKQRFVVPVKIIREE